jgi:hypothetical protein
LRFQAPEAAGERVRDSQRRVGGREHAFRLRIVLQPPGWELPSFLVRALVLDGVSRFDALSPSRAGHEEMK